MFAFERGLYEAVFVSVRDFAGSNYRDNTRNSQLFCFLSRIWDIDDPFPFYRPQCILFFVFIPCMRVASNKFQRRILLKVNCFTIKIANNVQILYRMKHGVKLLFYIKYFNGD